MRHFQRRNFFLSTTAGVAKPLPAAIKLVAFGDSSRNYSKFKQTLIAFPFANMFWTDFFHADYLRFSRQTPETDEILKNIAEQQDTTDFSRIRCPLCQWQPQKSSRWCCADAPFPENFYGGCDTHWNTFETRGKCPGCQHQWRYTTCLSCHQNSLHEKWYVH